MNYDYKRYAVSWVPGCCDAYHEFGLSWTGWSAECGERADAAIRDRTADLRPDLSADITDRGLYGNIRSPFRLATGRSRWALDQALDALARQTRAIVLPGLRVGVLSGRVGFMSAQFNPALSALIERTARMVRLPQVVPAPAHPSVSTIDADTEREQQASEMFFVPLTDQMTPEAAETVAKRLEDAIGSLLRRPVQINDLALMGDPGSGRPWRLVERYHLAHGITGGGRGQALEVIT